MNNEKDNLVLQKAFDFSIEIIEIYKFLTKKKEAVTKSSTTI